MRSNRGLSSSQQDAIRLEFFRAYRGEHGCASVGVVKDGRDGSVYLNVGIVDDGDRLPSEYQGLSVRTYSATRAMHAVYQAAG